MLYQELQLTYRDPLLQADTDYRNLIWRVLGRFADYTEYDFSPSLCICLREVAPLSTLSVSAVLYCFSSNHAALRRYCHRVRWPTLTSAMNLPRQNGFRQKLDVLAWRTQRRLAYL